MHTHKNIHVKYEKTIIMKHFVKKIKVPTTFSVCQCADWLEYQHKKEGIMHAIWCCFLMRILSAFISNKFVVSCISRLCALSQYYYYYVSNFDKSTWLIDWFHSVQGSLVKPEIRASKTEVIQGWEGFDVTCEVDMLSRSHLVLSWEYPGKRVSLWFIMLYL